MQSLHPSILPFLVYAVVAMMQAWTMIRRLFFAGVKHSTTTSGVETWHLRMGRIGILLLTIGTMLDNLRHVIEGFSWFWPDYLHAAQTASEANEIWLSSANNLRNDAWFLKALFRACVFGHEVLTPMGSMSLTQIAWKSQYSTNSKKMKDRNSAISATSCFGMSLAVVLALMISGVTCFRKRLSKKPSIVNIMDSFSLDHQEPEPQSLAGVLVWQFALLILSGVFWSLQTERESHHQRQSFLQLFLANVLCIGMHASRGIFQGSAGWVLWLPNMAEQIAVRTNIVLDEMYNPVKTTTTVQSRLIGSLYFPFVCSPPRQSGAGRKINKKVGGVDENAPKKTVTKNT